MFLPIKEVYFKIGFKSYFYSSYLWVSETKFKSLLNSLLIITFFSEFVFVPNCFVSNKFSNELFHTE